MSGDIIPILILEALLILGYWGLRARGYERTAIVYHLVVFIVGHAMLLVIVAGMYLFARGYGHDGLLVLLAYGLAGLVIAAIPLLITKFNPFSRVSKRSKL